MNEPDRELKRRAFLGALAGFGLLGLSSSGLGYPLGEGDETPPLPEPSEGAMVPDAPSYFFDPGESQAEARVGDTESITIPTLPTNPNILVVMVDQLRVPLWLDAGQLTTLAALCPNIYGDTGIYQNSVVFQQYYVNATACTPSRSAMLTGLYVPQTAQYRTLLDQPGGTTGVALDPNFPTFGHALPALNSLYSGHCYWIGKWHLSYSAANGTAQPLSGYGFNVQTIPGPIKPSPNGLQNEGINGGVFSCITSPTNYNGIDFASDADIEADFESWYAAHAVSASPWCTVVSFINPHDISGYPRLKTYSSTCLSIPPAAAYFPAPPAIPAASRIYSPPSGYPSPWNYETPSVVMDPSASTAVKPALHWDQYKTLNLRDTPVTDYLELLNYYYYEISFVDTQIGSVLSKLNSNSTVAAKTVVVFTSDHGDYVGSHGMHAKGGAVYDEAMRVPLCVMIPGLTGQVNRYQMCSAVDFFGLICDLGTGGTKAWRTSYPNLANREAIYDFLLSDTASEQKRLTTVKGESTPYILHTTDEQYVDYTDSTVTFQSAEAAGTSVRNHVACLRTKTQVLVHPFTGAKLSVYTHWNDCTLIPDGTGAGYEYYDYTYLYNRAETSNNFPTPANPNSNANSIAALGDLLTALGDYGSNVGLIQTEIKKPLTGNGVLGTSLAATLLNAEKNYKNAIHGSTCP